MLLELRTSEQLKAAVAKTEDSPDFLTVHYSLVNILEGNVAAAPARAFVHTDSSGWELYIVVRNAPNRVFTVFGCVSTAAFDVPVLQRSFQSLHELCSDWLIPGRYNLLYGVDSVVKLFSDWLQQHGRGKDFYPAPTYLFYMTQEQMDAAVDAEIRLPEGYSLVRLEADKHADVVTKCWKFALPNEVGRTRISMQRSTCYGVRHDKSGDLAAFELVDISGKFYHLFTTADHRRRGLANAVELANSKGCIRNANQHCQQTTEKKGVVPFKCVETPNEFVWKATMNNPLWTMAMADGDGTLTPVIILFSRYEVA